MASVYLAHDVRHNRPVAIKVLHPDLAAAIGADRFLREIQVIARLRHPHIVPLYDSGEAGERLYYVMPYVKGESMRERIKRTGPFAPADAQRITIEVADALDYAHAEGVVHRDIKPDNIMLDDRHALVTDFGIARALSESGVATLTQSGLIVGTPTYMSPEQVVADETIDGRSDIYSLGCVLFEMLAGKPPFAASTPQAMMAMRFSSPTPSLEPLADAPENLKQVITTSMKLNAAERYQTAREMVNALDTFSTPRSGTVAAAQIVPPAAPAEPVTTSRRLPIMPIAGGALIVAVALFFASRWRAHDVESGTPTSVASVGVLPFQNQSGDKQLEYFSDGLTDELISALSHVQGLQVAGRSSSFSIKGKNLNTHDAAQRLQVAYVVDAGVRSSGSRVRVTWQLVDAKTDRALGSGDIDGEIKDAIALQDSMASRIVEGLKPVIGARTVAAIGKHSTVDPEAHDLYLKGHFYWNQRTTATMRQGIEYLNQAIEKDSTYALAWAELATAYTLEPTFGDMPPSEALPPGRIAAQKAVSLDSTLAEAQTALGISLAFIDRRPKEALVALDKAIALDPQNSFPRLFRVWPLVMLGRLDEALVEVRRARALDPLSSIINTRVGTVLIYAQRYNEAVTELTRTLDLDPSNLLARFELGKALTLLGKYREAAQDFPNALDLEAGNETATAAWSYGLAGDRAHAKDLLSSLELRSRERYISEAALAGTAIAAGNNSLALDYLEKALTNHAFLVIFLPLDVRFDAVRGDPRFQRVIREAQKNY